MKNGLKGGGKNINKKEFCALLSKANRLASWQAELGVEKILEFFFSKFQEDCIIEIRGFGKFISKNGKARFKSFTGTAYNEQEFDANNNIE
jgi:nucleoid DNA-binding protein